MHSSRKLRGHNLMCAVSEQKLLEQSFFCAAEPRHLIGIHKVIHSFIHSLDFEVLGPTMPIGPIQAWLLLQMRASLTSRYCSKGGCLP